MIVVLLSLFPRNGSKSDAAAVAATFVVEIVLAIHSDGGFEKIEGRFELRKGRLRIKVDSVRASRRVLLDCASVNFFRRRRARRGGRGRRGVEFVISRS